MHLQAGGRDTSVNLSSSNTEHRFSDWLDFLDEDNAAAIAAKEAEDDKEYKEQGVEDQ